MISRNLEQCYKVKIRSYLECWRNMKSFSRHLMTRNLVENTSKAL